MVGKVEQEVRLGEGSGREKQLKSQMQLDHGGFYGELLKDSVKRCDITILVFQKDHSGNSVEDGLGDQRQEVQISCEFVG